MGGHPEQPVLAFKQCARNIRLEARIYRLMISCAQEPDNS